MDQTILQAGQQLLHVSDVLFMRRMAAYDEPMPAGIIDDDFGMELLVLGSLVSLNLPVRLVYEGLWRPHYQQQGGAHSPSRYAPAAGPPMRIVFRLQARPHSCWISCCCTAHRLLLLQISAGDDRLNMVCERLEAPRFTLV